MVLPVLWVPMLNMLLPHEYGFNGDVTVKAHLRMIKMAFGKSISPKQVSIKTHTRKVDLPEKSF